MTPSTEEIIAAIQELVTVDNLEGLQAVLSHHPFLMDSETDQQLTGVIQEGLARERVDRISLHLTVRGFLRWLRENNLEVALDEVGGLPLYEVDPIAQLLASPSPAPDHIARCRKALKLTRPESEPSLWAYLHFLLADRLVLNEQARLHAPEEEPGFYLLPIEDQNTDKFPAQIQEAIHAYHIAAESWERCGEDERTSEARYEEAHLLIDFSPEAQCEEALSEAIELLQSTLKIWSQESHPQRWGDVQAALGLAIKNRPAGLDAVTLEEALSRYEAALQMPAESAFEKARRQYHLATLYNQRYRGNRTENIEQALSLLQTALNTLTRNTSPESWAAAKNALGNAYQLRLRGDPAVNIRAAIQAYKDGSRIWTEERHPVRYAKLQQNLAEAYRSSALGQTAANQEEALICFKKALRAYEAHGQPAQRASVHNSMANLYCTRVTGDRIQSIERGIEHYQDALQLYSRIETPREWAQTLNNLANAYCERRIGERTHNLQDAIDLYKQVLEVRTREAYPREWAATHNNIGTVHAALEQWEEAITHFKAALEVRTVETLPDKAMQTARNLGDLHLRHGQWEEAIQAYQVAQAASDTLYRQAITEPGKQAEISRYGNVAHHLAYALARDGKPNEATVILEAGRARILSETLALEEDKLKRVDPHDQNLYNKLRDKIRSLESELRAAELSTQGALESPNTARSFLEIAQELRETNQALKALVLPTPPLQFEGLHTAVRPDHPLAYLVVTPVGGLALIVHTGGVEQLWLDSLTDEILLQHVQDWFDRYFAYRQDPHREGVEASWFDILDATTHWLWEALVGPLVNLLQSAGCHHVILVPTGLLTLLPLHAAWHKDGAKRRYALDDITTAYTPSARALAYAQRIAGTTGKNRLVAVRDPSDSLTYAKEEIIAVRWHFPSCQTLEQQKATPETVLKALCNNEVYHFACHGHNDWTIPLQSALQMYGRTPLTLENILSMTGKLQARLGFLSACESGLVGTALPDEVIGLSAGFLRAGTAGIVSTLWPVDDASTAALAGQFYEAWRSHAMSPAEALVTAQQYVRSQTKWNHPHYWAAFTLTGI